ncbi:MAG TPA: DUF2231 domain-containing protein [Vicinamibacterales bacterium]|nr:DUF2231 domain-containing protein [Vicinamibacterales bacterium]
MALIGRLHPLLIHFPIALVIVAAAAEGAAIATADDRWRTAAVINIRVGAALAVAAAFAGWRLARGIDVDTTSVLEWHRWLGTAGATLALAAGFASGRMGRTSWRYRGALFGAAALIAAAGHLGGVLVWGADFLRP